MNGYINIVHKNKKFPYSFEDGKITIYSKGSLPLGKKQRLYANEPDSEQPYVIGTNTKTQDTVIFFVDERVFIVVL